MKHGNGLGGMARVANPTQPPIAPLFCVAFRHPERPHELLLHPQSIGVGPIVDAWVDGYMHDRVGVLLVCVVVPETALVLDPTLPRMLVIQPTAQVSRGALDEPVAVAQFPDGPKLRVRCYPNGRMEMVS